MNLHSPRYVQAATHKALEALGMVLTPTSLRAVLSPRMRSRMVKVATFAVPQLATTCSSDCV